MQKQYEPLWIFVHFWGQINKRMVLIKTAHLQHWEVGLAWQTEFLLLWWVGVEAVVVQPAPKNLNCLLGQVAAATALPKKPSAWQVKRGAVVAVRHSRGVLLFQSWGRWGGLSVTFSATVTYIKEEHRYKEVLLVDAAGIVLLPLQKAGTTVMHKINPD